MPFVNIVTALALLQFLVFGFRVGGARERLGIKAPATTGHETFERLYRVHMNTLEMLIAFLPGLYLFSNYFNPLIAAGLGVPYLAGREIYAAAYVKEPKKRGPGFGLSFLPTVVLIVGGLVGAVRSLVVS
jgi:glutathione S-transferase